MFTLSINHNQLSQIYLNFYYSVPCHQLLRCADMKKFSFALFVFSILLAAMEQSST